MSRPMRGLQFALGLAGVVGFGALIIRGITQGRSIDGGAAITAILFAGCAFNLIRGLGGLVGGDED